jgi:hypothetical protein
MVPPFRNTDSNPVSWSCCSSIAAVTGFTFWIDNSIETRPSKRREDAVTNSSVLKKRRNGLFVRVAGTNRFTEPCLAEAAERMGFDVVWFDMEHRPYVIY